MSVNVQHVATAKAKQTRDPRSTKPGTRNHVVFVVGILIGAVLVGMDLPKPLVFAWLLILSTYMVLTQMPYAFERMAVANEILGPPACPRCDHYQRSPSGWCEPCVAQLSYGGGVQNPTLDRLVLAIRAQDLDAASALLAEKTKLTGPAGMRVRGKAERVLRRLHKGGLIGKSQTHTFISGCGDPADPTIAWASIRTTVDWKFTKPPLDIQTVSKYTLDEQGLINEVKVYPGRLW